MKTFLLRFSGLALIASSLAFVACGDSSTSGPGASGEIPDAPDAAVEMIARQLGEGNTGILWQAMPASYQSDIDSLVRLAGTKIDPEIYDQSFALVGRLGEVAGKQSEFIANNQFLAQQPDFDKGALQASLPAFVDLVGTLTSSEIATVEGLRGFQGQRFFETTVSEFFDNAMTLAELSEDAEAPDMDDLKALAVKLIDRTDESATLEITVPGEPAETQLFTKVEDRWVPADMAAGWSSSMAEARSQLEAIDPEQTAAQKPQIMGVLTMFEGVLTQLEAAETQAQFDQALQGAMMPIMGLMMMGGGMGGPQGAPAAPDMPQMQTPPAPPAQ